MVIEVDFFSSTNQHPDSKKIDGKDFYKNFTLSFIEKELWKPSAFEKEIIQAASECFTDKLKNFL